MVSCVVADVAIYSVSVVDNAIMGCFLMFHDKALSFFMKTKPVVHLLSSESLAQSASLSPTLKIQDQKPRGPSASIKGQKYNERFTFKFLKLKRKSKLASKGSRYSYISDHGTRRYSKKKQQELGNEIIRNLVNWKKDAVSKKTPEYFEKRRKISEKLIEDTDQDHIVAESIRDEDQSYFRSKFIEQIREDGAETLKYLEECEKKLVMTLQPRSTVATRKTSTSKDTKQVVAQQRRIKLQHNRISNILDDLKMIQIMTAQPYVDNLYKAKQTLLDDW
ncbi:hypothetical protein WA026_005320 [Henosepilachna vigintioctopunctata]|uniref:Uncharacterized protein n=1 Tax=Henosepilachna vigintioctopunctata TaxID=420089 RepID=A0AAW1UX21_9CUCU